MYADSIMIQFHMMNIKCFHLLRSDSDASYELFDLQSDLFMHVTESAHYVEFHLSCDSQLSGLWYI